MLFGGGSQPWLQLELTQCASEKRSISEVRPQSFWPMWFQGVLKVENHGLNSSYDKPLISVNELIHEEIYTFLSGL